MVEISKSLYDARVRRKFGKHPFYHYFIKCDEFEETLLPVLLYVERKTLCLQSYTLSIGHCNALAKACEYLEEIGINRMIFGNCGVDDEEFAAILGGIKKLKNFKKIVYRYNVFQQESYNALRPILAAKIPNHLEELRIENCQMSEDIVTQLLETLTTRCFLKALGLVKIGLTELNWPLMV